MRRHHTGSGRRGVFHPDWAAHASAVVDQTVTSCTITVGPETDPTAQPVYNPALGYSEVAAGTAVYTGGAEIMALAATDRRQTVAEDEVASQLYEVKLLAAANGIFTDHIVRVVTSDDPDLVGKTLAISEVERGGRRFSRVLLATLND